MESTETSPAPNPRPEVLLAIHRLGVLISGIFDRRLKRHDFTTTEYATLLAVCRRAGTPTAELAAWLGVRRQSLACTLASLEERLLIRRSSTGPDLRVVNVEPTQLGRVACDTLSRELHRLEQRILIFLGEQTHHGLVHAHSRLHAALLEIEHWP